MKSLNNFAESFRYDAPQLEVVEISVERGFELSFTGVGTQAFDEEDW